jgi:hypothetical protein
MDRQAGRQGRKEQRQNKIDKTRQDKTEENRRTMHNCLLSLVVCRLSFTIWRITEREGKVRVRKDKARKDKMRDKARKDKARRQEKARYWILS